MFTLHCKPLYTPTDITPPNAYPTLARLHRHTYQTCLIIKPIPWGKSDRAHLKTLRSIWDSACLAHRSASIFYENLRHRDLAFTANDRSPASGFSGSSKACADRCHKPPKKNLSVTHFCDAMAIR